MRRTVNNNKIGLAITFVFFLFGMTRIAQAAPPKLKITGLQLVSSKRISLSVYEYTYRAVIENGGGEANDVKASIGSTPLHVETIDGELSFGTIGTGQIAYSSDTFIVRHDRISRFDETMIAWTYEYIADGLTVLEGATDDLVTSATSDFYNGDVVTNSELSFHPQFGEIARTKLTLLMNDQATVREINHVLTSGNAIITSMLAGSQTFGLRIPDPGNLENLDALIANLKSLPGVEDLLHVIKKSPNVLPGNPGLGADPKLTALDAIDHHLAIKAHGVWNANQAFKDRKGYAPTMFIMDYFGLGAPQNSLWSFKNTRSSDYAIGALDDNGFPLSEEHGYEAASVIGASFGGSKLFSLNELATGFYPEALSLRVQDVYKSYDGVIGRKMGWDSDSETIKGLRKITQYSNAVLNISLGDCGFVIDAQGKNSVAHCRTVEYQKELQKSTKNWIKQFDADLRKKVFMTVAAGNYWDTPEQIRAEEEGYYQRALLGPIDATTLPFTNGLVVGSSGATKNTNNSPFIVGCQSNSSSRGANIGGIGINVLTLGAPTGFAESVNGTSFATPQIAALAAAIWTVNPKFSPENIKHLIQYTGEKSSFCPEVDAPYAANAYAALLAVDKLKDSYGAWVKDGAPVRKAILDVTDTSGGNGKSDGKFTIHDIVIFLKNFAEREQKYANTSYIADYSRFDLNGDGYTGGDSKASFNLDETFDFNNPSNNLYTTAPELIEGNVVNFSENQLTDLQILIYYAYSDLFDDLGNPEARTWLLLGYMEKIGLKLIGVNVTWKSIPSAELSGLSFPPVITLTGISNSYICDPNGLDTRPGCDSVPASPHFAASEAYGIPFPKGLASYGEQTGINDIIAAIGNVYIDASNKGRQSSDSQDYTSYYYGVSVNAFGPKGQNKFTTYTDGGGDYFDLKFSFQKK